MTICGPNTVQVYTDNGDPICLGVNLTSKDPSKIKHPASNPFSGTEKISPDRCESKGKYSFSDNIVAILLYTLAFALAMGITDLSISVFEKFGGERSSIKMNLIYVGVLLLVVVLVSGMFDRSFTS